MNNNNNQNNEKIGIIAGNGLLPDKLINSLKQLGKDFFVISIAQEINENSVILQSNYIQLNISAVGKAIKALMSHNIKKIVFAGSIKKPKLTSLRPDLEGIKLISQIAKNKNKGDNTLLTTIISFFESKGFEVLGVKDITKEILASSGNLTSKTPSASDLEDINYGKEILNALGYLDVGQSVIVQNNTVLGIEATEGTDALIKRCGVHKTENNSGTLIKMKKSGQDGRIDLPTIGLNTIENIYNAGFSGIAVEAGEVLMLDKENIIKKANELDIFITGIE